MYIFGNTSEENLKDTHHRLARLARAVLAESVVDFAVVCGFRDERKQTILYQEGKSKLRWPRSKHNRWPSHAVDICPYAPRPAEDYGAHPLAWQDREAFYYLAGLFQGLAPQCGLAIRWGGAWNGQTLNRRGLLDDIGHFEIKEVTS